MKLAKRENNGNMSMSKNPKKRRNLNNNNMKYTCQIKNTKKLEINKITYYLINN